MHEMKLNDEPFRLIKAKTKTIEMRLNDEKRSKIEVGDKIKFTNRKTNEEIIVEVVGLCYFSNFGELYEAFDNVSLGYREDEEIDYHDMEKYYSKEEQDKYGVVGIEVKLLS